MSEQDAHSAAETGESAAAGEAPESHAAGETPAVVVSVDASGSGEKQYFARVPIVQDGKQYPADGKPLPANFPASSLQRLLKDKSVGETPPATTKIKSIRKTT